MHEPYPGELRTRVIDFVQEGGSRRRRLNSLMSASVLRSGGCSAFVKTGLSNPCPVEDPSPLEKHSRQILALMSGVFGPHAE